MARDLKELQEWFNGLFTSESLQNFLVSATHGAVELIKVLPQVGQWLEANRVLFTVLAVATAAYYGATIQATLATIADTIAETYRRMAYEISFRWLVISTAATSAYSLVTQALTGQITLQTAVVGIARNAWAALSAVMLANPIGIVIIALAALAAAVKYYSDNTGRSLRLERLSRDMKMNIEGTTRLQTAALEKLSEQLGDYNEMTEIEQGNYVKNVALGRMDLEARIVRMKAREQEMEMLAAEPSLWQKLWLAIRSDGNTAALLQAFSQQAIDNMAAVREQFSGQISGLEGQLKEYDRILKQIERNERVKPTGGGSPSEIIDKDKKGGNGKKDTAAEQAKRDADELERLLTDARQRIAKIQDNAFANEQLAFGEHYAKLYLRAGSNQEKVIEIYKLGEIELAGIKAREADRQLAEEAKQRQIALDAVKDDFERSVDELELLKEQKRGEIEEREATKKIGEPEAKMLELEVEAQFLTAKLMLQQAYGDNVAETERKLTANTNAQAKLRADTDWQYKEQMKLAEWNLRDARRDAMAQGVGILKGFLKEGTLAYKAAIVAQKAYAIAQVVIDTQREIAQIYANPVWSLLPDAGLTLKTAAATATKIRAGIGIAGIAATGIQEIAQKADGGYTDVRSLYGSPGGYVDEATLFNLGNRSYIAGEKGREFVISNPALREPIVADFANILNAVQQSGQYGRLPDMLAETIAARQSASSSTRTPASTNGGAVVGGAGGADSTMQIAMLRELQALRQAVADQGSKPVTLNTLVFDDYRDYVTQIKTETSL